MPVTAALKFVQGLNVGTAGQALIGVSGSSVTASNGNDALVTTWTYTMVDVPVGSAVPTGVVQSGSTPTFSFTPDVSGSYFLMLSVVGSDGSSATDARIFGVLRASGRLIPAFTGVAASHNFAGQVRGWAKYMEQWLIFLDGLSSVPTFSNANIGQVLGVVTGPALAWVNGLPPFNSSNIGQSLSIVAGPAVAWAQTGPFGIGNGGAIVTGTYTMQPTDFNLLIAAGAVVTMPSAPILGATYRMTTMSGDFQANNAKVNGNPYNVFAPDPLNAYDNSTQVALKQSGAVYSWWWTGTLMVLAS